MNNIPTFVFFTFISFLVGKFIILMFTPLEDLGINIHPSGEAVYIDGDGCTINSTVTHQEFTHLLGWCNTNYLRERQE